jgi:hypothetical protein
MAKVEKLVKVLKDREDINVIEYFFLAFLVVAGAIVVSFEYLL